MHRKIIRVRDVMHQRFCILDGRTTVTDAVSKIRESDGDAALIRKRSEDDELGMVQLSDIAKKVMAKNKAPDRVSLYEIMVKPVIGLRPDMDVRYCARLFHNFGLSAAPVLGGSDDEVLGILGYRALVLDGLWVETQAESLPKP